MPPVAVVLLAVVSPVRLAVLLLAALPGVVVCSVVPTFLLAVVATVRELGCPSLFVTFTANGSALEVGACLRKGGPGVVKQVWTDRWDLCSDVFDQHVKQLIKELMVDGVLGDSLARFHVLEFQKRGLLDEVISARIPKHEKLREFVCSSMVHTCGDMCLDGVGGCKKFYPKASCDATHLRSGDEPGDFVQYCRDASRRTVHGIGPRAKVVREGQIVPHSPYLMLRHGGAHVDVEVCASSTSRVYLAKYLIKAPAAALPASPSLAPLAAPAAPAANGLHRAC